MSQKIALDLLLYKMLLQSSHLPRHMPLEARNWPLGTQNLPLVAWNLPLGTRNLPLGARNLPLEMVS